MNEENVVEGELGLGIDGGGGELDGVDVDVNQLGVTMTLESLISKDQIQLVKSNRLTRQLANQKDSNYPFPSGHGLPCLLAY